MEKNSINGYKFYDNNNNKLNIISCVDCQICEEWKNQLWKTVEYCPVHCHLCYLIGYNEEFTIFPDPNDLSFGYFLCNRCNDNLKEKMKPRNLIYRSIHGHFKK